MKALAIRLEDDLHAQLRDLTVTDAIRQAIEQWVEQSAQPRANSTAQSILDEIERDAAHDAWVSPLSLARRPRPRAQWEPNNPARIPPPWQGR